jgi:hypothetical protein
MTVKKEDKTNITNYITTSLLNVFYKNTWEGYTQ